MAQQKQSYGKVQVLTLPSHVKVRARRPSVLSLIASGGFPAEMTMEVFKLLDKKSLDSDLIKSDPAAIRTWSTLIDAYVPHVLVEPKIGAETKVEVADDGTMTGVIALSDLLDGDKHIIFLFGNDAYPGDEELERTVRAADLGKFRDGAAGGDARPGVEAVREPPVGDGGFGPEVAPGA